MMHASSDNSEVCTVAELKNLQLFILMISRLKKAFAHCIDIVDSDCNMNAQPISS